MLLRNRPMSVAELRLIGMTDAEVVGTVGSLLDRGDVAVVVSGLGLTVESRGGTTARSPRRAPSPLAAARDRIIFDAVLECGEVHLSGLTYADWLDSAGMTRRQVDRAVERLAANGLVEVRAEDGVVVVALMATEGDAT